ncbi:MAG: PAS domain S-box protein, partial [Planctomycetota bacterium]|nr:PAS domain S-box protein [Planctomycetota bacterium]
VAIWTHPKKGSAFTLANVLWLFVAYAAIHAVADFLAVWAAFNKAHGPLREIEHFITYISYLFLFEFGRRLTRLSGKAIAWWTLPLAAAGVVAASLFSADPLTTANVLVGYMIRFPAGLMAGFGLLWYWRSIREKTVLPKLGVYFTAGAVSLLAWAFFCGFVRAKGSFFPANWLNIQSFGETMKIPVYFFRAACALVSAWAFVGILKIFSWETIAKLQQAQQTLERFLVRQGERHLDVMDKSSDMIVSLDAEYRILGANRKACDLLGFAGDELGGKHVKDIFTPDTWLRLQASFDVLKRDGLSLVEDGQILKKNGGMRDGDTFLVAAYDNLGQQTGVRCMIRDVTERRQAQQTISRNYDTQRVINSLLSLSLQDIPNFAYILEAEVMSDEPDMHIPNLKRLISSLGCEPIEPEEFKEKINEYIKKYSKK